MDAIMPVITDPKKLVRRQMKMIVGIATRPDDPYPKRAERLKALRFCTDDVKFEVLKASDRVSEDLYDGLFALYFGEPIQESTDTMTDERERSDPPKRSYSKRMTDEETVELINFYLDGASYEDIAERFGKTVEQIKLKLRDERRRGKFKHMFTDKAEKAAQTTEEKFKEIISSVDAGSKPKPEPKQEHAAAPDIPSPNDLPKAFTATGRGFLSTDSGIKLDEEPITTLLRQKIKEKGLAQFYAEVEIIIRPVAPVGMVVTVEE